MHIHICYNNSNTRYTPRTLLDGHNLKLRVFGLKIIKNPLDNITTQGPSREIFAFNVNGAGPRPRGHDKNKGNNSQKKLSPERQGDPWMGDPTRWVTRLKWPLDG